MSIINFSSVLDIDYTTDCEDCQCGSICRCSIIENIKINPIRPIEEKWILTEVLSFYFPKIKNRKELVNQVTDLLRGYGYYNAENYEVDTCDGYYGEEIAGAYHIHEDKLDKDIKEILIKYDEDRLDKELKNITNN